MNNLDELTYKVNGCAKRVHNELGCGFQELIYQRCLAIELFKSGIKHKREVHQKIFYKDTHIGTRRADFIIENTIVVEIKAQTALTHAHLVETKNYLNMYDFPIGLLINFGAPSLEFKKVFRNDHK